MKLRQSSMVLMFALALMQSAAAQTAAVFSTQSRTSGARMETVSLRFDSAPLSTVLDEIARQTGVQIGYRTAVVSAKPTVTVSLTKLNVHAALHRVLAGSG